MTDDTAQMVAWLREQAEIADPEGKLVAALLDLHVIHAEPERLARNGEPTGHTVYWCEECDHDRDYGHIAHCEEGCRTLRLLAYGLCHREGWQDSWRP